MTYFDPYSMPFPGEVPDLSFYGSYTPEFAAALEANGGFYGSYTPEFAAALEANGGFYGPDTSWIQAEMDANFDPTNPYMTDAILDSNAYAQDVYDDANQAWDEYIRSDYNGDGDNWDADIGEW